MADMANTRGIYAIINKITGDLYVGSSKHIEKRLYEHRRMLNDNKHHCWKLQCAWMEHGEDAFDFAVWEIVKKKQDLREVEQRYIDMFHPSYNAYLNTGAVIRRTREHVGRGFGRRIVSL